MVATLGLLGQISDNNINVKTAYKQDMGIVGAVMVNFKIVPCIFVHRLIVYEGLTRPFIIGKEFLSHHCFTLAWTDDNKSYAEYRYKTMAVASQTIMDDRIIVSYPVKIPARNFAMVPTKCPDMFTDRVEAWPCQEFR